MQLRLGLIIFSSFFFFTNILLKFIDLKKNPSYRLARVFLKKKYGYFAIVICLLITSLLVVRLIIYTPFAKEETLIVFV